MIGSTALSLIMTVLAAYPLSKKHLVGGGLIMTLFVLTMYLNPGVIPEYLNVRDFGMIDTIWSLPVSYTHLDVYKRQDRSGADRRGMYRSVPGCGRRVL